MYFVLKINLQNQLNIEVKILNVKNLFTKEDTINEHWSRSFLDMGDFDSQYFVFKNISLWNRFYDQSINESLKIEIEIKKYEFDCAIQLKRCLLKKTNTITED